MHKGQDPPGRKLLPQGRAWLLVEFGGDEQMDANANAEKARVRLQRIDSHSMGMRLIDNGEEQDQVWYIRENGVGASRVPEEEEAPCTSRRCCKWRCVWAPRRCPQLTPSARSGTRYVDHASRRRRRRISTT